MSHALVIEDDDDVRALLRSHLVRWGWLVEEASTGEQGLLAARTRPPALVVLDLLLPGISGREVMSALRSDPVTAATAVVVTSVLDREDQLALRPDGVLAKPFTRRDLRAVLTGLGMWPRLHDTVRTQEDRNG
jgi:DNA-binding response OmpR family regulator